MNSLPDHHPDRSSDAPRDRSIAGGVVSGLSGATPPTLSIGGNAFTLIDSTGEQEAIETKYIDVVIMDVNLDVPLQRVWYGIGKKYDPNNPQAPLCFSDNGVGASTNAREPQSTSCKPDETGKYGCPMSAWTGPGVEVGQGGKLIPSCKVYKKLAVLVLDGDVPMYDMAFQLRVPVMSHTALQVYGNQFRSKNFDVSEVVTRITFTHGKNMQLEFECRRESPWLRPPVEELVKELLARGVTDGLVGRNDRPVTQIAAPQKEVVSADTTPPVALPPQQAPVEAPKQAPRKLASKPAAVAAAPSTPEAKPAPAASPRPLPSFLQPKGGSPPDKGNGTSTPQVATQPAAPPASPPSELQAALTKAFNLKL